MTDFRPSRFQILPVVVKNLIIINTLIMLAQFILERAGIDITDYLGLHYWRSYYFRPWQFLTHMFMHGNFTHLFLNMFALWMFGSILENVWGPKRFIMFYLICGVGAAVLHMSVVAYEFRMIENAYMAFQQNPTLDQFDLFFKQHANGAPNPDIVNRINRIFNDWSNMPSADMSSEAVSVINQYLNGYNINGRHFDGIYDQATVGASGAVFGILFAFGYLFPNTLLYVYFLVPIKAKYMVAIYAAFELFAGFQNSAGDNVAHFAHLGGMLVGFILLKIWNRTNRKHFY
jgi:membrane associated rhomboid family serine protease